MRLLSHARKTLKCSSSIIKAGALTLSAADNAQQPKRISIVPAPQAADLLQTRQQARRYAFQLCAKARREAAEMLAAARAQAEEIKKQAYREGYQEGHGDGDKQGRQEGMTEGVALGWRSGLERARDTIQTAQEVLKVAEQVKAQALASVEHDVLELALAVSEKVARRELQLDYEYITSFVSDVLRSAPDNAQVTVRIPAAKDGYEADHVAAILQDLAANLRVVTDENLEMGDCIVESGAGVFDGRICTRLAAIRSAFGVVSNEPVN